jgi:hypothetical protein
MPEKLHDKDGRPRTALEGTYQETHMAAGMDRCLGQRKIRDGRHAAAVSRQMASSGGGRVAMVVRLVSLVGRRWRLRSRLERPGRLGFFFHLCTNVSKK